MAARQCLKRVHLEVHRPELAEYDADARAALEGGHAVGAAARRLYGGADPAVIPLEGGLAHALRKTRRIVADGPRYPLFEATFECRGVRVRIDALLPDGDAWRIVEVKASTRVQPHYVFDCAVQTWVFRNLRLPLAGVTLAHVDSRFVYGGDKNFAGLLHEADLRADVAQAEPLVPEWVRSARQAVDGPEPAVAVGAHCFRPHDCPFIRHCWPQEAEFPLHELPRADKNKLGRFVAAGYTDLRAVPPDELTETQRRVRRVAIRGEAEILPSVGTFVRALGYPRYYLDFESIGPAVPVFAGMRPYRSLPFQFSCHYEAEPGRLEHADFLDVSGVAPFRRLAESLLRCVGQSGPILTYSAYENTMFERLAELFPDLAPALRDRVTRLVDLKPVVQAGYYHPAMRGSWSIKALLPCIAPEIDYKELDEIQDGMAASSGYLEAIDPATPAARVAELTRKLRRYCRLDTAALVRIVEFFAAR